jgi:hypothetical protein
LYASGGQVRQVAGVKERRRDPLGSEWQRFGAGTRRLRGRYS